MLGLLGAWCPTLALGLGEKTPEGGDGWWWSRGKEESRPQTEEGNPGPAQTCGALLSRADI